MSSSWGSKARGYFLSEEELGKKDDDHKPAAFSNGAPPLRASQSWQPARGPRRTWLLKRVAPVIVLLVLVYLFFTNIPTNMGPDPRMRRPSFPGSKGWPSYAEPLQPKPKPETGATTTTTKHDFDGPVRFLELAATIQAIGATNGANLDNRNVLFAVSSLKSAATLLPFACQMGVELKSYVHFALMSQSDISIQRLKKMNGIDDSCNLVFHDARVDHASMSSDERMETAVFRAFHHINNYMHPQAIMVDGSHEEETFFERASRAHAKLVGNTLIEIPPGSRGALAWMTKLDSASLKKWYTAQIDILVHAPRGASGSLIRLLRSLSAADYTASSVPHLTIELPHDIDPPTKEFLENFQWPPHHVPNPTNAHHLTLRHRIPGRRLDEEESSARFLESFWPSDPKHSHVLVLSPQVELSPHFFHYMKYNLLWFRYSEYAKAQGWDKYMFGISLEQPRQQLDGTGKPFVPPKERLVSTDGASSDTIQHTASFLWQATSSDAGLYMGDKWMELHDFVSRSLNVQSGDPATIPAFLSEKVVGTQYPSWLEHAVRLSRLRGYWMVYPGEKAANSLVTVHTDKAQMPEEYEDPATRPNVNAIGNDLAEDASDEEYEAAMRAVQEVDINFSPTNILQGMPDGGALSKIQELGVLSWDGQNMPLGASGVTSSASQLAVKFRRSMGCDKSNAQTPKTPYSTADLFCSDE